jgi:GAF domain-containing protein/HAMP domain-containing protein
MGILTHLKEQKNKEARVKSKEIKFRGSLTSTLVWTLLFFAILPLVFMSSAAYLRTRTMIRELSLNQTQVVMTAQLNQSMQKVEEKETRLTVQVQDRRFSQELESAFHANRQSSTYAEIHDGILRRFASLNNVEDKPKFNQFFLLDPDGTIQIATNANWEGVLITDPAVLDNIQNDHASILTYNLVPLYPDQLILLTAIQYRTPSGSSIGTVVGVTEAEELMPILQSVKDLSPTSETYLFIPPSTLLGMDAKSGKFVVIKSSDAQLKAILPAFDKAMGEATSSPMATNYTAANGYNILAQTEWLPAVHAGVVLELHEDVIFAQLNSLAPFTLALLSLSLVGMGLIIWAGTNRVIKPLRALTGIAQKYAQGDWSQRAPVKTKDEIGLLAYSFNNMADDLSGLYHSLEQKVDERTRQIRTASEVAQSVIGATSLDELLNKTAAVLVERFSFYHAGIFLVDSTGKYATLSAAFSHAAQAMLARGHRLEVGSASIIGWVTANNQSRIVSDVVEDPIHLVNEFLPETRSEIGIPISIGNLVLGVLDVQSTQSNAFGPESSTIVMLQTLASQIASAIRNVELIETAQINVQEVERLYRSTHLIAETYSEESALEVTGKILKDSPYPYVILNVRTDGFEIQSYSAFSESKLNAAARDLQTGQGSESIIRHFLTSGPIITGPQTAHKLGFLTHFTQELGCQTAAFLPVKCNEHVKAIIMLGSINQALTTTSIQPYAQMTDLLSATLEKNASAKQTEQHLTEMGALAALSQITSASGNLESFYSALHEQVKVLIGDYSFMVALYDARTDTISIPFSYEDEKVSSIESFPLGQGLTSILLRTKQPLMLVEDTERESIKLGAKLAGRPARSWLGTPLLIQNRPIGALIIQDTEHEHAFTEDNLRFFTTLASQVAGVIYNVILLEESQSRAIQLQTAAEIARDISASQNLDELLLKAVNLIRDRFSFYYASVFLLDLPGEFAAIREATGEAGAQLKRNGYKIAVGSKSIIGYVASHGESLVVNDTARDATFLPNTLLPDTRAEATIPLKFGERILGVLDVQSTTAFSFAEDNLRSLQILADQLAIAVVNAELFAETQEHLSQHRLLHHITTATASGSTLEEALDSAVNGLQVSLGGDRVTILLTDEDKRHLEVKASVGYSEDAIKQIIQIGTGVTGWVGAHRRSLRLDDVREDSRYIQLSANTRSELAVPLVYRNELLGVLNVESEQLNAYTENDEEMLGTLGGSLAAIIANAQLLEQIRYQSERERLLFEVTNKIRRSSDIQTILMTTASELSRVIGARHTQIKIDLKNGNDK